MPGIQPGVQLGVAAEGDVEQRCVGADEVTHRRNQPQGAVGGCGGRDQARHIDADDDTLFRGRDHQRVQVGANGGVGGVGAVQLLVQVVPDQVDEPGNPQGLTGVVHVQHQRDDASQHEQVREQHRQPGHVTLAAVG